MAYQTPAQLKARFEGGDVPTEQDFTNFIDSVHLEVLNAQAFVTVQAAIDSAATLTTAGAVGRRVGVYVTGEYTENVVLAENVILFGDGEMKAAATGPVIDTPVGSTFNPEVRGLLITGLGSGTAGLGIRFRNVTRGVVKDCRFNDFADQAILHEDGAACWFVDNFAQNCLLDRTQAAKSGVLQIDSLATDDWIARGEYTASSSQEGAVSDANLRICAGKISGANHYIDGPIFEISDVGLHLDATRSRLSGVRTDLNYGHGFEIAGTSNQLGLCFAFNNGQDANNTYDGYSITAGSGIYTACKAESNVANDHRYGFSDSVNSDNAKNRFDACFSAGHATAGWNTENFAGASVTFPAGPPKTFSALDATPSVDQYGSFRTNNASPTTITNFDDGVSGQEIFVRINDANTTIDFSASNLKGNGGVDWTPVANSSLRCLYDGTNWYCVASDA